MLGDDYVQTVEHEPACHLMGRFEEAARLREHLMAVRCGKLWEDHADTVAAEASLGATPQLMERGPWPRVYRRE